jgi:hypothetical protein
MRTNRWEEKPMSTVRRHAAVLLLLLGAAILGFVLPARADPREISVGGVWITLLDHDVAGYTSYQRAVEVRRRITEVLSIPELRQGAVVAVKQVGHEAVISVGDVLVFTVTPDDVAGTWMPPLDVARQWARLLAAGLSRAMPDADFHTF